MSQKTFVEMLPTATAKMREFVEAYEKESSGLSLEWTSAQGRKQHPLYRMRSTPPAEEPVSAECRVARVEVASGGAVYVTVLLPDADLGITDGGKLRVTKIEEPQ